MSDNPLMLAASPTLPERATIALEVDRVIAFMERTNRAELIAAAEAVQLPVELVRHLVINQVVSGSAGYPLKAMNGWVDLVELKQVAKQLNDARQLLAGVEITSLQAHAKYGFAADTIVSWANSGWVKVLRSTAGGHRWFDEGDIAFAKKLVELAGHRQGKQVFPRRIKNKP